MFKRTVLTLALILLLSGVLISATRVNAEATQYVSARIVNPADWSSNFALNSSEYPVNSTFTVNFYLESVRDLEAWQIYISWNSGVINFTNAWIPGIPPNPGSNVFTEALNENATPIVAPAYPVFSGPDPNIGYLLYGMTALPQPSVTMPGEALLCSMNFTVQVPVAGNDIKSTNITLLTQDTFDSHVTFNINGTPDINGPLISAAPATVLIYGPNALVAPPTVPETTLNVYTVDASTGNSTSSIPITVTWQNGQKSDYTEQGAKTFDLGNWTGEVNISAGDSSNYNGKTEPPFNVHAGQQSYTVELVEKGGSPWPIIIVAVAILALLIGVAVYVSRKRKVTTSQSKTANPRKSNHKKEKSHNVR